MGGGGAVLPRRLHHCLLLAAAALALLYWAVGRGYHQQGREYRSCEKKTRLGFLKTHKCASSSVQNILMRFGQANKLNFALPTVGNYLGRYVSYSRAMLANTPWERAGLEYQRSVVLSLTQIFCLHTIWNQGEVERTLGPGAVYLTIMRDPVQLFESLWVYAGMESFYNTDLETFAMAEKTGRLGKRAYRNLGRNQMLWDAGLPEGDMDNSTAVRDKIGQLERRFDLVMMAEQFDQSLVLLRDLMCWHYTDVVNFKLNARQESRKVSLSGPARAALRQYLAADYMLYDHFRERFAQKVAEFGPARMEREVAILRQANSDMQERCEIADVANDAVSGENRLWGTGMVAHTAHQDPQCSPFVRSEMSYIDLLREEQAERAVSAAQTLNLDLEAELEAGHGMRLALDRNTKLT